MRDRSPLAALLLIGLVVPFVGCTSSPSLTSLTVSPTSMNFGGAGLQAQLTATGSYTHPGHPPVLKDITDQVTWASSAVGCVTVSNTGMITSGSNVCSDILVTASMPGFNGLISGTMTVNVTQNTSGGGGGGGNPDVTSVSIIPSAQSVATPNQTAQFIAIGTTGNGATESLTNAVTWNSSSVQVATISSTGLATGVGQGTSTITAQFTNADSTVATGTATFTVTGGTSEPITALTLSPNALSLSSTQTGQFLALGTSGTSGLTEDVTNAPQLQWSSSIPSVATVTGGLVTGVAAGSTTITAKWTNPDSTVVTATAVVTVSATAAPEPLLSIAVLPSSITINDLLGTGQFLAYGTFSTTPTVMDITNGFTRNGVFTPVTWVSAAPFIFPIDSGGATGTTGSTGGLVTADGSGTDVVYAVAANPDGSLVYSPPVTFNCPLTLPTGTPGTAGYDPGSCNPSTIASGLLVTVSVFNAGLNTTGWLITAPSATGTPDVIHCGPGSTSGGSVCTASYPLGATVTLTAPAEPGVSFGGWSYNCDSTTAVTAAGPNSCTITLGTSNTSNVSIGAIFN